MTLPEERVPVTDEECLIWYEEFERSTQNTNTPEQAIIFRVRELIRIASQASIPIERIDPARKPEMMGVECSSMRVEIPSGNQLAPSGQLETRLRELTKEWRKPIHSDSIEATERAYARDECADELDAALSVSSDIRDEVLAEAEWWEKFVYEHGFHSSESCEGGDYCTRHKRLRDLLAKRPASETRPAAGRESA